MVAGSKTVAFTLPATQIKLLAVLAVVGSGAVVVVSNSLTNSVSHNVMAPAATNYPTGSLPDMRPSPSESAVRRVVPVESLPDTVTNVASARTVAPPIAPRAPMFDEATERGSSEEGSSNAAEEDHDQGELSALARVHRAITTGDAPVAWDRLLAYRRRFPKGLLTRDAAVLEVDILAALGRTQEARKAGERFLGAFPNGPEAARIRRLLTNLSN